ncbi:MAG: cupin domain-containing protein [Xanthobacteraceae bacterium]|jgi:quercetin dioxygenase-like cupin family protein
MITLRVASALVMVGLFAFSSFGHAQTPQAKRPVAKPLTGLDLAAEMDSVQGRSMCMQLTTYESGASNSEHSHKDRPEVVYILSGKIIDHRGDVAKEYGPGDTFTADRNTVHWMENKGTVAAVMLVTGIANKECAAAR